MARTSEAVHLDVHLDAVVDEHSRLEQSMASMALSGRLGMLGSFSALPFFTESLQRQ
jgi:hypothetical protein